MSSSSSNHASGLSTAAALFFSWSLMTYLVRVWVKLKRSESWGHDDTTISVAMLGALVHIGALFWAVHRGYGIALDDIAEPDKSSVAQAIYASQLFYIFTLGLSKVSTGLFISRLTRSDRYVKSGHVATVTAGGWTVASIIAIAVRSPLSQPWAVIDGSRSLWIRWLGIEICGILVELVFWGLSMAIVWSLSMPLHKRIFVLLIFGVRLLLLPMVALRLYYLSPGQNTTPTLTNVVANIMTEATLEFALISASVTCLKPFLRPFHSKWATSHVDTDSTPWPSALASKQSKDPYYMLSAVRGADKDGEINVTDREASSVETRSNDERVTELASTSNMMRGTFRPDDYHQHAVVLTRGGRQASSDEQGPASESRVIRKTETFSIRIEENPHGRGQRSTMSVSK